jgi:hypothetical protein
MKMKFTDFLEEQGLLQYVKSRFPSIHYTEDIMSYETLENGFVISTEDETYRIVLSYDSATNKYDYVAERMVNDKFELIPHTTYEERCNQPILTQVLGYSLVVRQLKKK